MKDHALPLSEWRLIIEDGVTPDYGLSADEVISLRVGKGESLPMLRLYTYLDHCALVGRFQNVDNEINREACAERNISINRRPTGGGTILMGCDQLGLALVIHSQEHDSYQHARELMGYFAGGIVDGLASCGISAELRGKNDIEVNGKKIAGLGIYKSPTHGLLFHASVLVDLDIPLMMQVLRTPFEKISDKAISSMEARLTTIRRELGRNFSVEDTRQQIIEGYRRTFGIPIAASNFTQAELAQIELLKVEKYQNPAWINQTTDVPDATGNAIQKTNAGLLDVTAMLSGSKIKNILIQGDFFADETAIADIEGNLRWQTADPEQLALLIERLYVKHQQKMNQIPCDALIQVIQTAIFNATQKK